MRSMLLFPRKLMVNFNRYNRQQLKKKLKPETPIYIYEKRELLGRKGEFSFWDREIKEVVRFLCSGGGRRKGES
jgi:hypothetical protein